MCRLLAVTSSEYLTPDEPIEALNAMREGYDGSGVGIFLRNLGGPLAKMRNSPILSGIFSASGIKRLDRYMLDIGFSTKHKISFNLPKSPPPGVPRRGIYLVRAYDYPSEWDELTDLEKRQKLLKIRLQIREMGKAEKDLIVFSFWPDTIMVKEIGDPLEIADYLNLSRPEFSARIIMIQGRQNTNYDIDLYACHPFFIEGFATMTNGENTAFIPNRDYLLSRGFEGYSGYLSDSEVFTHTLHYLVNSLGLGIEAYKHIITPLNGDRLKGHQDHIFLKHLKHSCRQLIIDGPNCVIGCMPDNTLFMVQDSKKLRPGIVGGYNGRIVFSSETCGLDALIPERDQTRDIQPMSLETVIARPKRMKLEVHPQTAPLPQ